MQNVSLYGVDEVKELVDLLEESASFRYITQMPGHSSSSKDQIYTRVNDENIAPINGPLKTSDS